jgi:hypothetical protein
MNKDDAIQVASSFEFSEVVLNKSNPELVGGPYE